MHTRQRMCWNDQIKCRLATARMQQIKGTPLFILFPTTFRMLCHTCACSSMWTSYSETYPHRVRKQRHLSQMFAHAYLRAYVLDKSIYSLEFLVIVSNTGRSCWYQGLVVARIWRPLLSGQTSALANPYSSTLDLTSQLWPLMVQTIYG